MMTILIFNKKNFFKRKAITFVEVMICILVTSLLMGMIHYNMSHTRSNYMHGVVNLQNLQEARLAINYLRRDFASCCPNFKKPSGSPSKKTEADKYFKDWEKYQNLRSLVFDTGSGKEVNGNYIAIDESGLAFYKYLYNSNSPSPEVEYVSYVYNGKEHTLTRKSSTKGTKVFKGFKSVKFSLYTHIINPEVPLLWVEFKINSSDREQFFKEDRDDLILTTTISSAFVTSSQNNKNWRLEVGYTLK